MKRDLAIDATRGLAIWSMIAAHFAGATPIAEPTHAFPYVDGMSAFVLLSGIVLGIVYQRWIDRHTLRYAYVRLAKRLAVLYLCQLTIALVAVAAAMAGHRWLTWLLPIDSWAQGIWLAVTMQYLPAGGNILLLYMVLMASAFALFPMLMRGWWMWILLGSVALYALSQVASPDPFYVTSYMPSPRTENWAGWQILFVPAVVVGWHWDRWRVAEMIDRFVIPLLVGATALAVAIHLVVGYDAWILPDPPLADKRDFGPARAICAWIAIPAVYGFFRLLLRWWHRDWLRPLVMTGSRSLDSYVIQAIALVVVPIHIAHRPWPSITTCAAALLVFGICWGWAEFRTAARIDKLHRAPTILLAQQPDRRSERVGAST